MSGIQNALFEAISHRPNGFLLDANVMYDHSGGQRRGSATFRLVTDICQAEFVSLWTLFDRPDLFNAAAVGISREILSLRSRKICTAAVAGSPVAWRLLEFIHPWLEEPKLIDRPGATAATDGVSYQPDAIRSAEDLFTTYLGAHGAALRGEGTSRLDGQSVLLFADCVGRRGSVLETARLVKRFGGHCVVVVAPVLITPDLILTELLTGDRPAIRLPDAGDKLVRVHSLCHFPIRELAGEIGSTTLTLESLFLVDNDTAGDTSFREKYRENAIRAIEQALRQRIPDAKILLELEQAFDRTLTITQSATSGSSFELDRAPEALQPPSGAAHWRTEADRLRDLIKPENHVELSAADFSPLVTAFVEGFSTFVNLSLARLKFEQAEGLRATYLGIIDACLARFTVDQGFCVEPLRALAKQWRADLTKATEAADDDALSEAVFRLFCSFQGGSYDPRAVYRIDPLTNLPGDLDRPWPTPGPLKPYFSPAETFDILENSRAVDFAFFRWEHRTLTSAFRLPRLFEKEGARLWAAFKALAIPGTAAENLFERQPKATVVTTVGFGDLQFRDFLLERAAAEGIDLSTIPNFALPRKDSVGSSSSAFFVPSTYGDLLAGRNVILLLSEVHTSNSLREILALLAKHQVAGVKIVCLISRMHHREAEFIARMTTLTSGDLHLAIPEEIGRIPIQFHSIMNIPEFAEEDVRRIQGDATAVFAHYERVSRAPAYARLVPLYDKYFRSMDVTSASFVAGRVRALHKPQRRKCLGEKVTLRSEEGKLLALCANLIAYGRYDEIIGLLKTVSDKGVLFRVICILMGDIRYLRVTGRASALYRTILKRLKRERKRRLGAESGDEVAISQAIDNEIHMMIGVALLAAHDRVDTRQYVFDFLNWGEEQLNFDLLRQYPRNALAFFGDERVGWVVSLVLHAALPDFPSAPRHGQMRKDLVAYAGHLIAFFSSLEHENVYPRDEIQAARTAIQFLLSELGEYEIQNKAAVVRLLHAKLLADPARHNTLDKGLQDVGRQMSKEPPEARHMDAKPLRLDIWAANDRATTKEWQDDLVAAIRLGSEIELVGMALIKLFEFSPVTSKDAGRFAVQQGKSDFTENARRYTDLLENARVRNSLSTHDAQEVVKLGRILKSDMFDKKSKLLEVLQWYIVPLRATIMDAAESADKTLDGDGYGAVWREIIAEQKALLEQQGELYVLCLDSFLKEVLENAFRNARHAFKGEEPHAERGWLDRVELTIEMEPATGASDGANPVMRGIEQPDYIAITIKTFGRPITSEEGKPGASTIARHTREIDDYGGRMCYDVIVGDNSPIGTKMVLGLISRSSVRARVERG